MNDPYDVSHHRFSAGCSAAAIPTAAWAGFATAAMIQCGPGFAYLVAFLFGIPAGVLALIAFTAGAAAPTAWRDPDATAGVWRVTCLRSAAGIGLAVLLLCTIFALFDGCRFDM